VRWLVDGMNVVGSRPDRWWRDRAGAARRLTAALQQLALESGEEITVVFEGEKFPALPSGRHGGVEVVYARRHGPDAADDRIVELVAGDREPAGLTVVTSDRDLVRRVTSLGARAVGARSLPLAGDATP